MQQDGFRQSRSRASRTVVFVALLAIGLAGPPILIDSGLISVPHATARSAPPDQSAKNVAEQVLRAAGVKGGLVVHLGCGNGRLTAALRVGPQYIVHGLDTRPENVQRARQFLREQDMYGPVAVDLFDGKRLPYADNLVNLIVAEQLGELSVEEAMRVLAPGGVLCRKQDGQWKATVKPRPDTIDDWTHYLHDASGNAVAHDQQVGPPRRVQWVADPRHARSHEHTPTIMAVVSAGGRLFYIADEGPTFSVRAPAQWRLVARDAFNGTKLWTRSIDVWFPHIVNWGAVPRQIERRLVATADRVYATLGYFAPVSALDAVTGKVVKVYDGTEGTEEIVLHGGVLLLAVRAVTDQRVAEQTKWVRLERKDKSPLFARETAQPLLEELRRTERSAPQSVLAVDSATGRVLWKKPAEDVRRLRTLSLCAAGPRAFFQSGSQVVCVDLKTGQRLWSASAPALRLVTDDLVVCAGNKTVTALSAETGQPLWSHPTLLTSIHDVFLIRGSLWLGGFKPFPKKRGPSWGPYFVTQRDLKTGEVLKHIEPENPSHHHRCYLNKATERYILGGRRGTEFIDLETGEVLWNSWVRGVCRYGVMPANGLFYAPPHACGCYITAKLTGFYALASDGPAVEKPRAKQESRLQRGPAYREVATRSPQPSTFNSRSSGDWPTYRHDGGRSGVTPLRVPIKLRRAWQTDVGDRLTSVTVAEGKVFVASRDTHTLTAIDAETGRVAWHFTAGGRIDSPPSIPQGQALFGGHDGFLYSVRTSDGELAWRLRAARQDRRVVVRGQVESAWPVLGSVLVDGDVVYATAGRSSYLDGGIDLLRVQPRTGEVLSTTVLYSPDPKTGKQPPQEGPAAMPGVLPDILSADERFVYLRDTVFNKQGRQVSETQPHLFTLTGFLDDTWPHRSYWIFGTRCSLSTGCSGRDRKLIYGRLLVFDDSTIYGYGRSNVHWSNQFQDGGYRLFAYRRGVTPPPRKRPTPLWEKRLPIRVRAMLKAGDTLFVAGPDLHAWDHWPTIDPTEGSELMAISSKDGSILARYPLDSPPILDGLAAASGKLYLSLENGQVVCWTAEE
ncbi:MAG: PQQ-binding-like beta-propeller repeat protein [Planctomycetes bacterium]|nr:PQQ-binding-like beta-propeller repeat protein [Planctomycetota bacterium]